jgi:hypothetical protein
VRLAETASAPSEAVFGPPAVASAASAAPAAPEGPQPEAPAVAVPEAKVRPAVEPAPGPTPVEAFDRAWARHATAAATAASEPPAEASPTTPGPAPAAASPTEAADDGGPDPEVAAEGGTPVDSASLSALLHGRLSKAWPVDPDAETRPIVHAPRP